MITKLQVIFVITLLAPTIWAISYQTSSDRTLTVQTLCASFPDRNNIISAADKTEIQQYNAAMKASFSVTGNQLISTVLGSMSNPDPNIILTKYPKLPQEYGMFVGPFVVCLFILMFTCLCTCCCCCCPAGCPPCGCCRKPMDEPYSKCELIWPGIVLLLALGLILAAGAVGLSKSKDTQTAIEAVGCSVAIVLDDVINGNVTTSGRYFIGIKTLKNKIQDIKTQLGAIATQLGTLSSTAINSAYTAVSNSIDLIGGNSAGARAPSFNYGTPMDGSTAITNTLPSTLPTDLGSTADVGTPIYVASQGLAGIQNGITQAFSNVALAQNTAQFTSALDSVKTTLSGVVGGLESGDQQFSDMYNMVTPHLTTVTTASTGIYAGLIGLACIGILATLLLLVCNLYKCRYLLYFTCVILLFVGIICLFLAIIFSTLIPLFYFTCDFTTYSLSSATNFNSNFGPIISMFNMGSQVSMITVCLAGQSGDFLSSGPISSYTSNLNALSSSLLFMDTFDDTALNAQIDNLWNPAKNMVENSYTGKRLDFSSASDEAILNRISNPANYPGCTAPLFASDSWIPTTESSAQVGCKGGFTNSATSTQCTSANLQNAAGSCSGCMSAHDILITRSGSVATDLATRYPGCATWISQLMSTSTAFYTRKESYYVTGGIINRKNTANTNVGSYKAQITSVAGQFNSVKSNLQGTVDSITNPTYGIIAGFNCAIIGEDILLVNNVACTHTFKLLFFIRAAFGIAGFGVLFTMYCAACTGVRHFKQSVAQSKTKQNQIDNPQNYTQDDLKPKNNDWSKPNINPDSKKNNYVKGPDKNIEMAMQKDYATVYQNQLAYY